MAAGPDAGSGLFDLRDMGSGIVNDLERTYDLTHGNVYNVNFGTGASLERIVVYLCLTTVSIAWLWS